MTFGECVWAMIVELCFREEVGRPLERSGSSSVEMVAAVIVGPCHGADEWVDGRRRGSLWFLSRRSPGRVLVGGCEVRGGDIEWALLSVMEDESNCEYAPAQLADSNWWETKYIMYRLRKWHCCR